MPDPALVTEVFEDLAVLLAALEAAHGRSERVGAPIDAQDPLQLALVLGASRRCWSSQVGTVNGYSPPRGRWLKRQGPEPCPAVASICRPPG